MSKQVRINDKAHEQLKELADLEGRSMSNMNERLINASHTLNTTQTVPIKVIAGVDFEHDIQRLDKLTIRKPNQSIEE